MGTVRFSLDLHEEAIRQSRHLMLSVQVDGQAHSVKDEGFEDGIARLQHSLPAEVRLVCCFTCLYADYSPSGHGLSGMACHRDAKEQYLAVRSKRDYWDVPVTEEVLETYVCPEYVARIAGTGYRG